MTTSLKRSIGHINDVQELRELRKAIVERIDVLERRAYAKRVEERWQLLKDTTIGTTLHVCAKGTFFGGPLQRGDSMTVFAIQPRARRIWVRVLNGTEYCFDAKSAERYDLRTEAPADPMDAAAREQVDRMAGRIAESLA